MTKSGHSTYVVTKIMMYDVLLQIMKTFPYNDSKIYSHQLKKKHQWIYLWWEIPNHWTLNEVCCIQTSSRICIRLWCYDGLSGTWLPRLWRFMTEQVPGPRRAKYVGRHMWTGPYQFFLKQDLHSKLVFISSVQRNKIYSLY